MFIFKQIFMNSFIYKFIKFILNMYSESSLKKAFAWIWNICINSFIAKKMTNFFDSVPRYKYSFLKSINNGIYNFIVKYSGFIYNFVDKTYNNSFFVKEFYVLKKKSEKNKLKTILFYLTIFMSSYTIISCFLERNIFSNLLLIILSILLYLSYMCSEFIIKSFINSGSYKIISYLLKWEVVDND